jgi:hypothetical protein
VIGLTDPHVAVFRYTFLAHIYSFRGHRYHPLVLLSLRDGHKKEQVGEQEEPEFGIFVG